MKDLRLFLFFTCSFLIYQVLGWNTKNPSSSSEELALSNDSGRLDHSLPGIIGGHRQQKTVLTPLKNTQKMHALQRNARDLMGNRMVNNRRPPMPSSAFNRQNRPRGISRPGGDPRGPGTHSRYRQAYAMSSGSTIQNSRPPPMVAHDPTLRNFNVMPAQRLQPSSSYQLPPMQAQTLRKPIMAQISAPSTMMSQNQRNPSAAETLSSGSHNRLRNQKSPNRVVEVIHHIPVAMNPSDLKTGSSAVVYLSKPRHNIQTSQDMSMKNLPQNPLMSKNQGNINQGPSFMLGNQGLPPNAGNNQRLREVNGLQSSSFIPSDSKSHRQNIQLPYPVPTTNIKEQVVPHSLKDSRNTQIMGPPNKESQSYFIRTSNPSAHVKTGASQSHTAPVRTIQNNTPQINRLKQELNAEIEELLKLVTQSPVFVTKAPKIFPQQVSHPFLTKQNQFNDNVELNKKEKLSSFPEDSRRSPDSVKIPVLNTNPEIQPHSSSFGTDEDVSKPQVLRGMKQPKVPERFSLNHRRPVVMESTVDSDELSEILEGIAYTEGSKLIHDVAKRKPVKLIISDQSENSKPDSSASTVIEKLSHSRENERFLKAGISSSENSHIPSNEDLSVPLKEELTSSDTEDSIQINSNEFNNEKISEAEHSLSKEKEALQNPTVVKTYWNFHRENYGVSTSTPQTMETAITKLDASGEESRVSSGPNNFQEQESIPSISVKEEFPLDEEMRKKYNHKQESLKQNLGTFQKEYKKQISTENRENMAPSHFIRYFPQRLNSADASVSTVPRMENKITHKATTISYEHEKFNTGSNKNETSFNKGSRFDKFPPKTSANKQRMNENVHQNSKEQTENSKTSFSNSNTTARPFQGSTQRPTPQYIISNRPNQQSVYGTRNRSRNRDRLTPKYIVSETPKYIVSETPKIFSEAPVLPEKHHANSSEHVMTNTFRQVPINSREKNFGFIQFSTHATATTQSNFNPYKYETNYSENGKEDNLKHPDVFEDILTTEIPKETTYSSSDLGIAESQLENTPEIENHADEYKAPQASNTNIIKNKQFFRGPQHSASLDESSTENPDELKTYFTSSTSFENTANPTTVQNDPEKDTNTHYNEPDVPHFSVHSQAKVINALHLANKVFGRRNFTSYKQPVSTTKTPIFKHKFTYSPVIKSSTTHPVTQPETTTIGRRVVFNFRTGTTHSLPIRTSSSTPRVIFSSVNRNKSVQNSRNNTLEYASNVSQEDKSLVSSSPPSVFHHVVFSLSNVSSNYDQSAETEPSKDLYGILKPITKPYNSSTVLSYEKNLNKVNTELFSNQVTSSTVMSTTVIPTLTTTTEDSSYSSSPTYTSSNTPKVLGNSKYIQFSPFATIIPISFKNTSYEQSTETVSTIESISNEFQTEAPSKNEDVRKGYVLQMSTTVTESPKEVATVPINQEQIIVDSLKSMKLKMQDMASKGLRHLMPLIMDLSYEVSISSDCTFSLLRWLRAVKSMEQWAIRMMDASSKMPEGILYGTFSTFGSYDECIAIKTPKANLQLPYSGQYCSINIQPNLPPNERHFTIQNAFRKYPKLKQVFQEMNIEEDTMAYYYILKHRIGLCLPSTCSRDDLGNVTEKLADELKMKISVERCETSEKPSFTTGQIVSMCGVFITFGIVILATIIDISLRIRTRHEMDIDEIIRKKNGIRQFSYVFSAFGNACKILDTSIPSTHLSSLHGIKFLSITWVMLGHVYYCKDYLTLAGLNKVRDLGSNLAFQVILNSAFAADTFFFLSGLLVVYSTFIYLENNNGGFTIVGFYIRRYWRLTPAFLMISGVILLGPLAGSGPIWHETLEPFVSGCQNYWWTNLFYFSNFVPTDKTCVPHGWFLSCDMQFYIVAPVIILALYRRPRFGIFLISLGILSSMVTTGLLTFLYKLPPVSLFSLPDPKDINEFLDTIGYKPYAHYASYCVGMATGFLLAAKQKISISKCLQVFGWVASTIGCCLVIYGTWNWNSGELPDWPVSVAYATTSRTIWSLGIAWLIVVCYAGHGGHVNTILSWRGFIPLSRLSYLAYLIHPLLMYLYASYVRSPFYFSQYVVVYLYLGHLCVTFGLAFLFSLAFEVPFLNLEKLVTKYLDKSKRKRRASFSNHHNNWEHPELPELKDSVVLMRRRADKFLT